MIVDHHDNVVIPRETFAVVVEQIVAHTLREAAAVHLTMTGLLRLEEGRRGRGPEVETQAVFAEDPTVDTVQQKLVLAVVRFVDVLLGRPGAQLRAGILTEAITHTSPRFQFVRGETGSVPALKRRKIPPGTRSRPCSKISGSCWSSIDGRVIGAAEAFSAFHCATASLARVGPHQLLIESPLCGLCAESSNPLLSPFSDINVRAWFGLSASRVLRFHSELTESYVNSVYIVIMNITKVSSAT
jgi:hypothetical protein